MGIPLKHHHKQSGPTDDNRFTPAAGPPVTVTKKQARSNITVPQFDGPYEPPHNAIASRSNHQLGPGHHHPGRHQPHQPTGTQTPIRQQPRTTQNAVGDLLPYCTMGPPLIEAQVIALSDAAGSLGELVLLALGAIAGDSNCVRRLEAAVGGQAAENIAEFFMDEWEMDG